MLGKEISPTDKVRQVVATLWFILVFSGPLSIFAGEPRFGSTADGAVSTAESERDVFRRLADLLKSFPEDWSINQSPLIPISGRHPGEIFGKAEPEAIQQADELLSTLVDAGADSRRSIMRSWVDRHSPTEVDLWLPAIRAEQLRMSHPEQAATVIEVWMRWAAFVNRKDVLLSAASDAIDILSDRSESAELLDSAGTWAALPYHSEAVAGRAHLYKTYGRLLMSSGDPDQAAGALRKAGDIYRAMGDKLGWANTLRAEADLLLSAASYQPALKTYRQARALYLQVPDPRGLANSWDGEARALLLIGRPEDSLRAFEGAQEFFEMLGDSVGLGKSLNGQGNALLLLNLPEQAIGRFRQARKTFSESTYEVGLANSWEGEANALVALRDLDAAAEAYDRALIYFERGGDLEDQVRALTSLGDALAAKGDSSAAIERYLRARELHVEALGERLSARLWSLLLEIPGRWETIRGPVISSRPVRSPEDLSAREPSENAAVNFLFFLRLSLGAPADRPLQIDSQLKAVQFSEMEAWLPGSLVEADRRADAEEALLDAEVWLTWAERIGRKDILLTAASEAIDLLSERKGPAAAASILKDWSDLPPFENDEYGRGRLLELEADIRSNDYTHEAVELYARAGALYRQIDSHTSIGKVELRRANLLRMEGRLGEALDGYRAAQQSFRKAASAGATGAEAKSALGEGTVLLLLGKFEPSLEPLRRADGLFESNRDAQGQAEVARMESSALLLMGRYDQAVAVLEQRAVPMFEKIGDAKGLGESLRLQADLLLLQGKSSDALKVYLRAQQILTLANDIHTVGLAVRSQGDALFKLGQNEGALDAYRQARAQFVQVEDETWQGHCLTNEADLFFRLGQNEEALEAILEARSLFENSRDRISQALTYVKEGSIRFREGDLSKTTAAHEKAALLLNALDPNHPSPARRDLRLRPELGGIASSIVEGQLAHGIGRVQLRKGETEQALAAFERAIQIFSEAGSKADHAHALDGKGDTLFRLGLLDDALKAHRRSGELYAETGSLVGQGNSFLSRAGVHERLGQLDEAIKAYEQASNFFKDAGDQIGLGTSSLGIAELSFRRGFNEEALAGIDQALKHFEMVGSKADQSNAWNSRGRVHLRLGKRSEASESFERALALANDSGYLLGAGNAYLDLGRVLSRTGQSAAALAAFENATKNLIAVGDPLGQANVLASRAQILFLFGLNKEARTASREALRLLETIEGSGLSQGNVHLEQANLMVRLGEHAQAIAATHRARTFFKANGDPTGEGNSWLAEATVLTHLNEPELAEKAYKNALGRFRNIGAVANQAVALHGLSRARERARKLQDEAKKVRDEAEKLFRLVEDPIGLGEVLMSKADEDIAAGQPELALASYREAQGRFKSAGARSRLGAALLGEAEALAVSYKWAESRKVASEAEKVFEQTDQVPRRVSSLIHQAEAHWLLQEHASAIEKARSAIRLHEDWRKVYLTDRHRTTGDLSIARAYRPLISILSRVPGRVPEALALTEQAKSRVLLDLMDPALGDRSVLGTQEDVSVHDLGLLSEEDRRKKEVEKAAQGPGAAAAARELRWDSYLRLAAGQRRQMLGNGRTLDARETRELSAQTGPILVYYMAPHHTLGFLLRPQTSEITLEIIRIPLKDLKRDIDDFLEKLAQPMFEKQSETPARTLWGDLIAPFAGKLPPGPLTVIPHGPLHRLPFSALLDPTGARLFERWSVAVAPSVSSLSRSRSRHRPGRADDLFKTLSSDLANAAFEAQVIADFFHHSDSIEPYFSGYRKAAPEARHLLIGTHGFHQQAELDGTYLKLRPERDHDSRLTAEEVANIKLDAELATLAACSTSAGRALLSDERLDLSRAFLIAGAASVLATRWQIPENDQTTSFLVDFYREYRSGGPMGLGMRKDEALALARRQAIKKGHPAASWAAWVLIGDAR